MIKLRRLLKLQPDEGRKVLLFGTLNALVHSGVAIGVTLTDALFLAEVGVDRLPYIYLFTPVVMLLYVPLFGALVRRVGSDRAFLASLVGLAVATAALYIGTAGFPGAPIYYASKFLTIVAGIALYTLYWNFTDGFFDIQDGKRLFPLFSAGGAAGATLGGLAVSALSSAGWVEQLFLAWGVLALLTVPAAVLIAKTQVRLEEDEEIRAAGVARKRKVGTYLPLFVGGVVGTLLLVAIAEYQYLAIFSESRGTQQLSVLLGQLYAVAGGLNLVINLFLFNRMVLGFGVPTVALVTPFAFLVSFTLLLVDPGMAAATFAFLVVQSIHESIDLNTQNFLYNAFPAATKKQIRTAIEGLGEPVATALGGALLLYAVGRLSPAQISTTGLAIAAGVLLCAILLRTDYLRSMVRNLKESWLDLTQPSDELLVGLSRAEIDALRARVATETDLGNVQAAIRILWLNDRQAAVDVLLDFIGRAEAAHLVASRELLSMILEAKDNEVIRRILFWVTEHRYRLSAEILEELGYHGLMQSREVAHLFDSEEPAELGAAVVTAWHSWRPEDRLQAMQTLDRLVQGEESFVEVGVRATGQLGQANLAHFIVPYLHHADEKVRRQAVEALRRTVTVDSNRLVPDLLTFLKRATEEERLAALEALGRIADTSCVAPLIRLSRDFTPHERRQTERVLVGIGLKSVPAVVSALRDPGYPYRSRALAARALGKLALPQLEAVADHLLRTEIERAFRAHHSHRILAAAGHSGPGSSVLSRFYADLGQGILEFILEIMTIQGRLPDFELVSAGLRSQNAKERGNAIETIEQGTPRWLFRGLLPLIEGRPGAAAKRAELASAPATAVEVMRAALDSPFSIEAAAGAQALWEADVPGVRDILRGRLVHSVPAMMRETIISLFVRETEDEGMNPVERLHYLCSARLFEGLSVWGELEYLSREAEHRRLGQGELVFVAGSPATELHLVARGSIELAGETPRVASGPSASVGEEGVFGSATFVNDAVSQGAETIALQTRTVIEAVRTYPSIGVAMFRNRITTPHGAAVPA